MTRPQLSVVVPYFDGQDQLDRLLTGLDGQSMTPDQFELVVADDGSPRAPRAGHRAYSTRVVGQANQGFRAAQARNLGAAEAAGQVIVFLDQDCIPTPDYLRQVATAVTSPWSLVVGHRLHARLDGWTPTEVSTWLSGERPPPPALAEPAWLLDGYRRTEELTQPDDQAYQLVISATLSLHRDLFAHVGGFDGTLLGYGGEDWELGHRCLVAGADLRWLQDAIVWHDGPDLAGREDMAATKNAETLALARRVPDPDLRGRHLVWQVPSIVVRLDTERTSVSSVVAAVDSLLAGSDAHVWVGGPVAAQVADVVEDPRVHRGTPSAAVLERSRYQVDCRAVLLEGGTLHDLEPCTPVEVPGLRMVRTRDANRHRRGLPWPARKSWPPDLNVTLLADDLQLERHWQGQRLEADPPGAAAEATRPRSLRSSRPPGPASPRGRNEPAAADGRPASG